MAQPSIIVRWLGEDAEILSDRVFQLLLLASIIAVLGTALLSPILSSLTNQFDVTSTEIGLLITAYSTPVIFLIPISGWLMDRYGRKPILIAGLLLFGIGGLGIMFTTSFRIAILLRLVQGIGYAGTIPVVITFIGDIYTGSKEVTGQGLRFAMGGVSQAVFPPIAGLLVLISWQFPFLIFGLAIPTAVVMHFWLEEPTANGNLGQAQQASDTRYLRKLLAQIRQPNVLPILFALAIAYGPIYAFFTYNSIIVVGVIGGTAQQAGVIVSLFSIVFAATATQSGRITRFFDTRTVPLTGACLCYGVGLVAFAYAPTIGVAYLTSIVLGVGIGVTFPLYRSMVTGFASEVLRGGLVSTGESMGWAIASLTPLIIGVLITALEGEIGTDAAIQLTVASFGAGTGILGAVFVLTAHVYSS